MSWYNAMMVISASLLSILEGSTNIVETPSGTLGGFEMTSRGGRVYQAWTSIPFALPPLGDLRFKAPRPAPRWDGVLSATQDLPSCLQSSMNITVGTEDCLYLSVYRPKECQNMMPVIFYTHFGAFDHGDYGSRNSPDYIMDENVVLVFANYRLNGFGFMSLGDTTLPGNFGLKDQALALKWVQKNILAFGGDPTSVTALGISSGAALSHLLLLSPATTKLVTRAMSESGTINHVWTLLRTEEVKNYTLQVVKDVNCSRQTNQEILTCLQDINSTVISSSIRRISSLDFAHYFFAPVIEPVDAEDAVITEDLSLRPSEKPWITSFTDGEYLLYLRYEMLTEQGVENVRDNLLAYLEGVVRNHTTDHVKIQNGSRILETKYFPQRGPYDTFERELSELLADESNVFPAVFNIRRHQGPKWIARFEHKTSIAIVNDPRTGRPFADNNSAHANQAVLYLNYQNGTNETESDRQVSKRLINRLVNFAYYSNPTPPGSQVYWNQFRTNQILRVTTNGDFMGDPTFFQEIQNVYELWYDLIGWH